MWSSSGESLGGVVVSSKAEYLVVRKPKSARSSFAAELRLLLARGRRIAKRIVKLRRSVRESERFFLVCVVNLHGNERTVVEFSVETQMGGIKEICDERRFGNTMKLARQ